MGDSDPLHAAGKNPITVHRIRQKTNADYPGTRQQEAAEAAIG